MLFTIVLVVLDTTTYPIRFFFFTIISIVFLNISNGFYQNSIYGAAAKLPDTYSNAVVFGNNICGTVVSLINIITVVLSPNLKYAAFFYFSSAIIILFACLITFKQLLNNVRLNFLNFLISIYSRELLLFCRNLITLKRAKMKVLKRINFCINF